ncbi:MAG: bifunctional diguanylate cyclase/phosphodiesterase, partial [Lapillicoccus sp.]
ALYESRGWLNAGLAVTGALLLLELLPLPPTDDVLRVVALLAGSVVVLPNVRGLVEQNRWALSKGEEQSLELRRLALHDSLTGMPNRALIMDRLEQLLARVRRDGGHAAVLFVDLDGFKEVNDEHGHDAGDRLLKAVASRLTDALREVDTCGRLGGDEFIVVVDCTTRPAAPELVAQRILDLVGQPFEIGEGVPPVRVTASVGIAVNAKASATELLRRADIALYQAKRAGRNRFEVFQAEMGAEPTSADELIAELRTAISDHRFHLLYQPIYDLDHLGMIGVEALIRLRHPTRGDILPAEFLPALDHSGLIIEVGRWVLREACTQMAHWHHAGHQLGISVNISPSQLDHDSFLQDVRDALRVSGLPPGALTLDVNETAILRDPTTVSTRLRNLKTLGVRIALDDFGIGYSSLAYLQNFPIDTLKIDRSFIEAIGHSRDADAIIRTLVQLGKDLGMTTVAEGVESPEQLAHVRQHGMTNVQGFLLSHPLDPTTFEDHFLRAAAADTPQPDAPGTATPAPQTGIPPVGEGSTAEARPPHVPTSVGPPSLRG